MANDQLFWLVKDKNGFIQGPLEHVVVVRLIKVGRVKEGDLIAAYPDGSWRDISHIPEFYDVMIDVLSGNVRLDDDDDDHKPIKGDHVPVEKSRSSAVVVEKSNSGVRHTNETHQSPQMTPQSRVRNAAIPEGVTKAKTETQKETHKKNQPREKQKEVPPGATIELSDEKELIRKKKNKNALLPLAVIAGALIIFYIAFKFEHNSTAQGQIHLLLPRKGRAVIADGAAKESIARAFQHFQRDTFSDYYKAQNILVEAIEGSSQNIDAMSLLCLTYRELWPYAYQDSKDLSVLSQMAQAASQLDALGDKGSSCRVVQQMLSGQYEGAQSKLKTLLSQFPTNPFFYEFKGQMLGDVRDYQTGVAFVQKTQQLLPKWAKGYVLEARFRARLGQSADARRLYESVIKTIGSHAIAKVELGRLEYFEFKHEEDGVQLVQSGLQADRLPNGMRSLALEVLAQYSAKTGDRAKAVKYAVEAYTLDPTNLNMKQMVLALGGDSALPQVRTQCQEIVKLAEQYAKSGNHLAAQAEFRTAFDTCEPHDARAAMRAGQSLWKLNQGLDAIQWMEKAIKTDPKLLDAYINLADYYSERFEFDKAYTTLKAAAAVSPQSYDVYRGYALVELKRNNTKDAIRYGEQALALYDNDMESHLILIRAYQAAKEYRKSYQIAARAIELDKNNTRAQGLYAEAYAGFEGVNAAVTYLKGLINTYPSIVDYRISLAKVLKMEDRFGDMIETLTQAIQMDSTNKEAHLLLGQAYQKANNTAEALRSLLTAATLDPSDAYPVVLIGDLYLQRGEFQPALENFERARDLNPRYPRASYYVGRAAFGLRNFQRAIEEAQKEKRINPNLSDAYILAGESYINMALLQKENSKSLYSKAVDELQRALKLRAQNAGIYVLLARAHRLSGNTDIAMSMLKLAARQESGNPDIYKERGAVYEQQSQNEQAVTAYARYLELAPGAPDYSKIQERIQRLGGR